MKNLINKEIKKFIKIYNSGYMELGKAVCFSKFHFALFQSIK